MKSKTIDSFVGLPSSCLTLLPFKNSQTLAKKHFLYPESSIQKGHHPTEQHHIEIQRKPRTIAGDAAHPGRIPSTSTELIHAMKVKNKQQTSRQYPVPK